MPGGTEDSHYTRPSRPDGQRVIREGDRKGMMHVADTISFFLSKIKEAKINPLLFPIQRHYNMKIIYGATEYRGCASVSCPSLRRLPLRPRSFLDKCASFRSVVLELSMIA